jgi:hypothetical protein
MPCSPQRMLANDRNKIREATLTASSVLPIANGVLSLPLPRSGTAQVALAGSSTKSRSSTMTWKCR